MLLLPEQTTANNPKTCFNWFAPDDVTRGSGEALSIRQMIEKTVELYNIDRARIFITGLSAGGAMTSAMLATYPEVFSAGAIIAGLPYGTATNVQQAFESMFQGRSRSAKEWGDLVRAASQHRGSWPRVSIWHGDADRTVVPTNAEAIVRQWTDVHGIRAEPVMDVVDGYPRKAWQRSGVDAIESYTITGMAHGTPLATGSEDCHCGTAGPFLIEAGISSSRHIAGFFGLTDVIRARETEQPGVQLLSQDVEIIPDERVEILDDVINGRQFNPRNPAGPVDVMAVITKALTSAGLMRSS